jgi:hypothetical protein
VLQKIGGKLVVMGNVPTTGNEFGKAFSTANFQSLGPKPAPTQSAVATQSPTNSAPSPTSMDTSAKP